MVNKGSVSSEGVVPPQQLLRRVKHSPGSGVLSVSVQSDGPTRTLKITDVNAKVTMQHTLHLHTPAHTYTALAHSCPHTHTHCTCTLPPTHTLHLHTPAHTHTALAHSRPHTHCTCTLTPTHTQYTHTSPYDDWVVVEHGLVAPAKSSDVDSCNDNSRESDEGDRPTLEMEVCHVTCK